MLVYANPSTFLLDTSGLSSLNRTDYSDGGFMEERTDGISRMTDFSNSNGHGSGLGYAIDGTQFTQGFTHTIKAPGFTDPGGHVSVTEEISWSATYGTSSDSQTIVGTRWLTYQINDFDTDTSSLSETIGNTIGPLFPGDDGLLASMESTTMTVEHSYSGTTTETFTYTLPGITDATFTASRETITQLTTEWTINTFTLVSNVAGDARFLDTWVMAEVGEVLWSITAPGLFSRLSDIAVSLDTSVNQWLVPLQIESALYTKAVLATDETVTLERYSLEEQTTYTVRTGMGDSYTVAAPDLSCQGLLPDVLPLPLGANTFYELTMSAESGILSAPVGTFADGTGATATVESVVTFYGSYEDRRLSGSGPHAITECTNGQSWEATVQATIGLNTASSFADSNSTVSEGVGNEISWLRTVWRTGSYQGVATYYAVARGFGIQSPDELGDEGPAYDQVFFAGTSVWYPFWQNIGDPKLCDIWVPMTFALPMASTRSQEGWQWSWSKDGSVIFMSVSSRDLTITATTYTGWSTTATMNFGASRDAIDGYLPGQTFTGHQALGGRGGVASLGAVLVFPRGLYRLTKVDETGGTTTAEISYSDGAAHTIPTNEHWAFESIPLFHAQSYRGVDVDSLPIIPWKQAEFHASLLL